MTDYLTLVNKTLRRINETPLDHANFSSARDLQATVKDIVSDTISRIHTYYNKWPFNAAEHTLTITPGQQEYGWPLDFRLVDWNSFYIEKDPALNIQTTKLKKINRDDWYNKLKSDDDDSNGIRLPEYVFDTHGRGFGVSPKPDRAYTLRFRYWLNPQLPANHDDDSNIPPEWDYVIIEGSLAHLKMFKENTEISDRAERKFEKDLKQMRTTLINEYDYFQDTRVNVNHVGSNGR